jgi:hypothetical protein
MAQFGRSMRRGQQNPQPAFVPLALSLSDSVRDVPLTSCQLGVRALHTGKNGGVHMRL